LTGEMYTRLVRAYPFGYRRPNIDSLVIDNNVKSWPGSACLTATHMAHKVHANLFNVFKNFWKT